MPSLGRFLQADPIGYSTGLNLYTYVDNVPLDLTDPSGMEASGDNSWKVLANIAEFVADISDISDNIIPFSIPERPISDSSTIIAGRIEKHGYKGNPAVRNLDPGLAIPVTGLISGGIKLISNGLKSITTKKLTKSYGFARKPVTRAGQHEMNIVNGNQKTTINGRVYVGHALGQMQVRGLVLSVIENTIKYAERFPAAKGRIGFNDPINNVTVITE